MIDQIQTNKLLFIDIETCGSYATIEELEDKNLVLFNLWNKMGDSYFRRHYPEDERMSDGELFKKYSGLLPEFGRVVCVSAGFITGDERKIQSFIKGGEGEILKETVNLLNRVHKLGFSLCGHNIKTFDLPYQIWIIDDAFDSKTIASLLYNWPDLNSKKWNRGYDSINGKPNILEQRMLAISDVEVMPAPIIEFFKSVHDDKFINAFHEIVGDENIIADKTFRWSGIRTMLP